MLLAIEMGLETIISTKFSILIIANDHYKFLIIGKGLETIIRIAQNASLVTTSSQRANNMEIYRKEGQMWVYEMFKANDEIELTSLGVHFLLTATCVDVDFEEETFSEEGNIY